jgi:hypothetical protein
MLNGRALRRIRNSTYAYCPTIRRAILDFCERALVTLAGVAPPNKASGISPNRAVKCHWGGQIRVASKLLRRLRIKINPGTVKDAISPQDLDRQESICHNPGPFERRKALVCRVSHGFTFLEETTASGALLALPLRRVKSF